ncbi:hypothetical protein FB451DRAFT_1570812 [Mycena latifolia]|nr:hypothetical protein FB451DRAFT_1570812 [Mycena latifolia]
MVYDDWAAKLRICILPHPSSHLVLRLASSVDLTAFEGDVSFLMPGRRLPQSIPPIPPPSHTGPAFTHARLTLDSDRRTRRVRGRRRRRAQVRHAARAGTPTDVRAVMRGQLTLRVGGVPSPAREARLAYRDVRMNAFAKPSIRPFAHLVAIAPGATTAGSATALRPPNVRAADAVYASVHALERSAEVWVREPILVKPQANASPS